MQQGNFSQAVSFGYSRHSDNDVLITEGEYRPLFGSDVLTYSRQSIYDQETEVFDLAWIFGYRAHKRGLIYGGPFLILGDLSGQEMLELTVTDEAGEITSRQDTLNLDSDGKLYGVNLAYEYKWDFGMLITAEVSWAKFTWQDNSNSDASVGFIVGYTF